MITREEFGERAKQTLRNILQKQERAVLARVEYDRLDGFAQHAGQGSAGDVARLRASTAKSAVHEAEINLVGALDQYSDLLYDVLLQAIERAVSPP